MYWQPAFVPHACTDVKFMLVNKVSFIWIQITPPKQSYRLHSFANITAAIQEPPASTGSPSGNTLELRYMEYVIQMQP